MLHIVNVHKTGWDGGLLKASKQPNLSGRVP
jgi:hypothetical protein